MAMKIFGGILTGALIGGALTYTTLNKKIKEAKKELDDQSVKAAERFEQYENEISNMIEDRAEIEAELNDVKSACKSMITCNNNIGMFCSNTIETYRQLVNPDMLADITSIDDIDYRDECLCAIDIATTSIANYVASVNFTDLSSRQVSDFNKDIEKYITTATDKIKDCIDEYRESCDDEDDDDDDELILVAPKRVIIKSLDGNQKIFDTEPDEGFEVIDGSDTENNDYCIDAQNIPSLYNFLFGSIKDQLAFHYVNEVNKDSFEKLLDDMTITVSLSYVDEDNVEDMIITAVNAVVPFELFGESIGDKQYKIYSIEGGELDLANAMDYFRNIRDTENAKDITNVSNENIDKTEEPKKEEKIVKTNYDHMKVSFDSVISDDAIKFIVETIGINRDSLASFAGNLKILMIVNQEAGEAIYDAYKAIVEEVQLLVYEEKLTSDVITKFYNSIRAIISNMKKNHGPAIKAYKYRMRENASVSE